MIIDFGPEMTLLEQVVAFRLNLSVLFMSGAGSLRYQIKDKDVPLSMLEQLNRITYDEVVKKVVARTEKRGYENFMHLVKCFSVFIEANPVSYAQFGFERASQLFMPTSVAAKNLSLTNKIGYHAQMVTGANILSRVLYVMTEVPLENVGDQPMDYKRLRKFFPAIESI